MPVLGSDLPWEELMTQKSGSEGWTQKIMKTGLCRNLARVELLVSSRRTSLMLARLHLSYATSMVTARSRTGRCKLTTRQTQEPDEIQEPGQTQGPGKNRDPGFLKIPEIRQNKPDTGLSNAWKLKE